MCDTCLTQTLSKELQCTSGIAAPIGKSTSNESNNGVFAASTETVDHTFRYKVSEIEHERWQREFQLLQAERLQQTLRHRAILVLALIAEPLERQWGEAVTDVVWSGWRALVAWERRRRQLPIERREFEQALAGAMYEIRRHARGDFPERLELQRVFAEYGICTISAEQLGTLARQCAPGLSPRDQQLLVTNILCEGCESVRVEDFLAWLYNDYDAESALWQYEWEVRFRRRMLRQLRRRAILILSLIAEPLKRQWSEAFLDTAMSAWKDLVADTLRHSVLPSARRQFEEQKEEHMARKFGHRQSFHAVTPRTQRTSMH